MYLVFIMRLLCNVLCGRNYLLITTQRERASKYEAKLSRGRSVLIFDGPERSVASDTN